MDGGVPASDAAGRLRREGNGDRGRFRYALAAVTVLLGLGVGGAAVYDVFVDLSAGVSLLSTGLENLYGLLVGAALAATGGWLLVAAPEHYVGRMARWLALSLSVAGLGIGWVMGIQSLQPAYRPLFLATDLFGLYLLAGLGVGAYDAQRRYNREALANERDRFAALFENVPNPVLGVRFVGDEPRAELVNPAFEETFGYDLSELAGRDLRDVLRAPGEEPVRVGDGAGPIGDVPGRPEEWLAAEVTLETTGGQRDFLRLTAPVADPDLDQEEFAFYIDITDRRQRRERLQVLSRTLRHDIRNRLSIIKGHANALADGAGEEEARMAGAIGDAADDLLELSTRTRRVEALVAGEVERRRVDLSALVADVLADVREKHPDAEVSADLPDGVGAQATDVLEVAVRNVVENAVVHNDAEPPRVEVSAVESEGGRYVDLRVADNGSGIPEDEFEVVTGAADRSNLRHSSGLGLWTANWILTDVGGDIEFGRSGDGGTVVTLRVPRDVTAG